MRSFLYTDDRPLVWRGSSYIIKVILEVFKHKYMRKIIYIVILACLIAGCKNQAGKEGKTSGSSFQENRNTETFSKPVGLPVIDFDKEYPLKKISLQDIAEVEYIPFETKPDVLLSGNAVNTGTFVSDSLIVVFNHSDGSVFVFNRQGKNLYSFNHTGRGPGEYRRVGNLAVDHHRQEIYVCDFWLNRKILVYALDGSFKRDLKLPPQYWITSFFNYDKDHLLCYEGYGVELGTSDNKTKYNKQPYALIAKDDGKITPWDITLDERMGSSIRKAGAAGFVSLPIQPLLKNGYEFLISDYSCDTIYTLKGGHLTPYLLKSPSSLWKRTPPILGYTSFKTNRYAYIHFSELKWPEKGNNGIARQFFYDDKTGEICRPLFINSDYVEEKVVDLENFNADLPENYVKDRMRSLTLVEDYKAGKLKGKLKEVASRLDEEANFVLMLIKFKE